MNSILLICAFQALFLSVLVLLKKKKSHSDNILAAWLLFIAVHILVEFLQFYNYQNDFPYPWLIGIDVSFSMLHPVLILFYILSYARITRNRLNYFWHFLPFVLINLLLAKVYYSRSAVEKIAEYNSVMQGHGYLNRSLEFVTFIIMAFGLGYLVADLILIHKHKRNLRDQLSNVKGLELQWLKLLLYIMGGILSVAILLEILTNTFQVVSPEMGTAIVFILIAIGIFYIGIHGIVQTGYFSGYNPGLTKSGPTAWQETRPMGKTLRPENNDQEQMGAKYDQLISFMETEKPFLETTLNLQSLALMLNMKPHFLSMVINQMGGRNFFDFVNLYRINEFKEQVLDPSNQHYTLLSIAFSCGFNSKTAFNRAFKNLTGQTPSEYCAVVGVHVNS